MMTYEEILAKLPTHYTPEIRQQMAKAYAAHLAKEAAKAK
jgi:hypothetical protein